MKNFISQWKAPKEKQQEEAPNVLKITKALPIIQWTEAFHKYLHCVVGRRLIPLVYVIRNDVAVPAIGAQATGAPHSSKHRSIESELIARASHYDPLYREDNSKVYFKLEEATQTASYKASIK
eukprot:14852301-Ditylum_brightwellii.AAC.1